MKSHWTQAGIENQGSGEGDGEGGMEEGGECRRGMEEGELYLALFPDPTL